MSFLKQALMKELKIERDFEVYTTYKTGFDEFDYRNGFINPETKQQFTGLREGSYTMVIGPSGSGKTTFVLQTVVNMAKPFKGRTIIMHYDLEGATSPARIMTTTGVTEEWLTEHYIKKDNGVYAENFYNDIVAHAKLKKDNREDLLYESDLIDNGKPVMKYVPSFIILDSLALLMPEKNLDEEGTGSNMSAAQAAKANSSIFKKLIPILGECNINLIVVNHVNKAIQTSMYQPNQKQVNYMKQDESVPGGNTAIYLANNLIKLNAKAAFKDDDKYKLKGFPIECTIIKSRGNRAGQSFELLYTQEYGFNTPMSKFNMAKNAGVVEGTTYLTIPGYNKKFRNSEFIELYKDNKEFKLAFDNACKPLLESYLSGVGSGDQVKFAITDDEINDIINKDLPEEEKKSKK